MWIAEFDIVGVSSLAFNKPVFEEKRGDETHDQREQRTWKMKINATEDGQAMIQPFALKNGIESAAKRLSMKVPGESKKTYTKLLTQGIMTTDQMPLTSDGHKKIMVDAVMGIPMFVPSDGKRGSGKRVMRVIPMVNSWHTHGRVYVLDGKITEKVLLAHLRETGNFIGFGAMRVEGGGVNGRFKIENFRMHEHSAEELAA